MTMTSTAWIEPPASVPWYLRPLLWVAARITGKDPLPGRLLAHFPKGAVGAGAFEALAASDKDLEARVLAVARIVASAVAGCPFCTDMNAATWRKAGLTASDLALLLELVEARWPNLGPREAAAARYAAALSKTPVLVAAPLQAELRSRFTPRELVVLASTIAQVNYWSRFNQGLGVPSSGFFADDACALPPAAMARINGDS
jgi:AhpD family alkylhydroperoxidase